MVVVLVARKLDSQEFSDSSEATESPERRLWNDVRRTMPQAIQGVTLPPGFRFGRLIQTLILGFGFGLLVPFPLLPIPFWARLVLLLNTTLMLDYILTLAQYTLFKRWLKAHPDVLAAAP